MEFRFTMEDIQVLSAAVIALVCGVKVAARIVAGIRRLLDRRRRSHMPGRVRTGTRADRSAPPARGRALPEIEVISPRIPDGVDWDGEYQEDDGFNYESITREGGRTVYRCGWYGLGFRFTLRNMGAADWRAYIDEQPSYRGRSDDPHTSHRYSDAERFQRYICVRQTVTSENQMVSYAADWSRRTAVYVLTGTTIDTQIENERTGTPSPAPQTDRQESRYPDPVPWDNEYEEADGFNYERETEMADGSSVYECGWYRMRYRFTIRDMGASGWRAYIDEQPSYRNRPEGAHTSHRLTDYNGGTRRYICIKSRVDSKGRMLALASDWSRRTSVYIKTGRTIDEQISSER